MLKAGDCDFFFFFLILKTILSTLANSLNAHDPLGNPYQGPLKGNPVWVPEYSRNPSQGIHKDIPGDGSLDKPLWFKMLKFKR